MATTETAAEWASFHVENVGGIKEADVEIPPGVTVLAGENATNRTSFLQAVMAAMGSTRASLKADAESGIVRLDLDGHPIERTLSREGDQITFAGDQYLENPEVADLFAFLLETNEARHAVAQGRDLREIIMRPVDVDEINREIDRLESKKAEINDELAEIESRKRDLPGLEEDRTQIRKQIEAKREDLATLEEEINEHNRNVDESRKEQDALESKLEELRATRADLESTRHNIETQEETIQTLQRELRELETELQDLPDAPMGEHADLEARITQLRDRRQTLNSEISDLQSLIQYNQEHLENGGPTVFESLAETQSTESAGSVTDQLLPEDEGSIVCWTCGSTVERDQIDHTVDRLQDLRANQITQLNEIKDELDELKAQQKEAKQQQQRRDDIHREVEEIERELERRRAQLDELKDQREALTADVETLEAAVDDLEAGDFDEILSLHKQANQYEFEIDRLESDLESVSAEVEEIESMIDRADELRATRETVVDDLTDQRTKIDQIEQQAVDQFNDHMDAILDILGYENLERVWIERIEQTVKEGRKKVDRAVFELHIVRTTESGTAYEDTIEHLSESEREVTGLIFALAGYLVHDLHESVPFMVLDSLEAIDSDRIARLVQYFAGYADYLVVALLDEDAQALDESYHYVTEI